MNGTIGVESEVGKGSTFWLELNIAVSPIQQLEKQQSGPISENLLAGTARTVLYVEDNLPNVKLIEGILERVPGLKLLTAMQGTLAIEMARHEQIDLILLDLHLPDIMGDEVLRRLKEDPRTCSIPVVVVSADATHAQIEALRAAGAHEYLTKPIAIKDFLRVLDETLNQGTVNIGAKVTLP
jgi:CheY-like chemotaxis protein